MDKEEAMQAVYQGKMVQCTKENYPEIRSTLQDYAGRCVDEGDGLRAMIALEEVKRLDKLHDF